MNIRNLLTEQFGETLGKESIEQISKLFEKAVHEKVAQEKTKDDALTHFLLREQFAQEFALRHKKMLEKQDRKHAAKLKFLIEAIDTDHTIKLNKVLEAIDKSHSSMLRRVINKYRRQLRNESVVLKENLVSKISDFLDLQLKRTIPFSQINEAVKNIKATKIVNKIKQLIGIDEEFIDNEVKEALKDGKQQIDLLTKELNEALTQNMHLEREYEKTKANLILLEKTNGMSSHKRDFIMKFLKNKSPDYIVENFDAVSEMFEKENIEYEKEAREEIRGQVNYGKFGDRPEVLSEQRKFTANNFENDQNIDYYLKEIKKLS